MSSLQISTRVGGRQKQRRTSLIGLRYGRIEFAATLASILYAGLAWYLVGQLGLTSHEAVVRTARVGTMWDGFDSTLVAFGFERPPLLTALAAPFGGIDRLREHGLTSAAATALASGVSVVAASSVARASGLTALSTVLFVAAFALNPLLIYAGAFGLPEMLYASLVLVALSQFVAWIDRRDVSAVIAAGIAIGLGFLVRYNVLVLAVALGWAFWWVARRDEEETREEEAARANLIAFLAPIVFIAGLWTMLAWFPRADLFGYVRMATNVSLLGAEDLAVLERMADLKGAPFGVLGWVGGWALLLAPASMLAVIALAAYAAYERARASFALAVACAAVVLPEAIALLLGYSQGHVHHLFVAVVPAFVILGYRERRLTGGRVPSAFERRRRRRQPIWCAALLLASLASAGAFLLFPDTERPASALVETARTGVAPASLPGDALAAADFILREAGSGDVVVGTERHAEVMLAVGDLGRFRTDADRREEATLYDPFEAARFVLVRRPLPGQADGRIERAYEDIFREGASSLSLAFEAGDYRIYEVTGPALP